jgi:hypothetical protein
METTPVPLQYDAGWAPEPVWTVLEEIKYTASYGNSNSEFKPTFVWKQIGQSSVTFLSSLPPFLLLLNNVISSIWSGPTVDQICIEVTRLSSTLTHKKGSFTNSNLVFTRQYISNNRMLKMRVGSYQWRKRPSIKIQHVNTKFSLRTKATHSTTSLLQYIKSLWKHHLTSFHSWRGPQKIGALCTVLKPLVREIVPALALSKAGRKRLPQPSLIHRLLPCKFLPTHCLYIRRK